MNQPGWQILYRGPLSGCNYACGYCPFAKTRNTATELRDDAAKLDRFVNWVEKRQDRHPGILFTPWGEALIHRAYQRAMLRLGDMPGVQRVAIQTNLSCGLDWLESANRDRVALWCTFHPSGTSPGKFAAKARTLARMGVRHSVGVVGLREHLPLIAELRAALPEETYLWVNAYKHEPHYYEPGEVEFLTQIDPLFPLNNQRHPSRGRACRAGHTSFTVDGDGMARRCHFIPAPLGNIYEPGFDAALAPRTCTNETCGCHIGYIHMPELGLYETFAGGLLERIPSGIPGTRH